MEFKDLIEARRSVRKYVASEISKAEVEEIVGETASEAGRRGREGVVRRWYELAQGVGHVVPVGMTKKV